MQQDVVTNRLSPAEVPAVEALVASAERTRGYRPVSDQFWIDLHHFDHHLDRHLDHGDNEPGSSALVSRRSDTDGTLLAYAQATATGDSWTVESVAADDGAVAVAALAGVLDSVLVAVRERGAADVTWLVQGPTDHHAAIAAARGLEVHRRLHQMRRSLPTGLAFDVETRPFDPARDIDPWVAVNARAFAWNPEQGSWTADSVRDRMIEPWFDPNGFLIHERDGRLAGFCWTKVHADVDPKMGEIYVVAIDPDFHGLGLGRALTLAGLDHLAARGIEVGMLFVDGDNVAAIRVYDRLGFVIHRTDTLFHTTFDRGAT